MCEVLWNPSRQSLNYGPLKIVPLFLGHRIYPHNTFTSTIAIINDVRNPRVWLLKIKAQRILLSDKFMGVCFSGLRQVNTLMGVCGGDGVKRVFLKHYDCGKKVECS